MRPIPAFAAATILAVVLTTLPGEVGRATAQPGDGERWSRLAGADRYGTAAAIARASFPDGAPVVYLARADVPVDAVAAGPLDDGPVLLVPPDGPVPTATEQTIADLGPSTVIALGGEQAVSDHVLADAAGAGGTSRSTDRLAGPDRYATAVAISRHAFPDGAGGALFAAGVPDALAAGVLTEGPLLLVPPDAAELPAPVVEEFDRLGASVAHVLTGPARLDPGIVQRLDDPNHPDGRVTVFEWHGPERIATATRVALLHAGQVEVPAVYVASAATQVDAVAAGSLREGPILLAPSCGPLPDVLTETLEVLDPAEVVGLGGPQAVCDEVLEAMARFARPAFPEPESPGELRNATPAPAGHVEPFLGSLVSPLAWARDGGRLLVHGTPPGRSSGFGPPAAGSSGIGLYVHDVADDRLHPVQLPTAWSPGSPELATLSADGSEVLLEASRTDDHGHLETWLLAVPVAGGEPRELRPGYVVASAGPTVVVGDPDPGPDRGLTVVDTSDGSTWDPDLDADAVSQPVPAPDASALLYHSSPRRTVGIVHRDCTHRSLPPPPADTPCRSFDLWAHDLSDGATHVVVELVAATPPGAPADCPRGPTSELRVVEVATDRSVPLVTSEGDTTGASVHRATISADASTVAFAAHPAPPYVATDEGGYVEGPRPDGVPFDGAPGPQDGEREVVYRVGVEGLLDGTPRYAVISTGTPWEHAYEPVVSPAGDRVAWKAQSDGRDHDLPREVVLHRTWR